ncbi:MAG: glycosyltransferase [Chloroflexi bacterium]|nr:glycosyltransferase [Chloroflexota bacterium]
MDTALNILYLVPYTPTPIRTRPYNLIRALVRRGHAVTLATVWESDEERETLRRWAEDGVRVVAARLTKARSAWNCLRALPTRTPFQAVWCWQPNLMTRIPDIPTPYSLLPTPFDVIHVEHLRGTPYALALKSKIPLVWDSVDCISYLFEQAAHGSRSRLGRWMTRLELVRTRRYEAWLLTQFDRTLVTSETDRRSLHELTEQSKPQSKIQNPKSKITVLPNGVALDYFTPGDEPRDPATVVFTGKMSYHANITAAMYLANDIMPRVWAQRPDVQLSIAGKDPPAEIRALAGAREQSAIQNPKSKIAVTGTVPDVRPYLRSATVAVAPILYGAGVQNKVLEAMACGTPVVASRTAVSALEVLNGEHLLVAGDADPFAEAILRLLDDAALCARLGSAGRRYVQQHHDWDAVAGKLEAVYGDVLREADYGS